MCKWSANKGGRKFLWSSLIGFACDFNRKISSDIIQVKEKEGSVGWMQIIWCHKILIDRFFKDYETRYFQQFMAYDQKTKASLKNILIVHVHKLLINDAVHDAGLRFIKIDVQIAVVN